MSGDLLLRDFAPRPRLTVPVTEVRRPRFPAIDAHNHLGPTYGGRWATAPVTELLDLLDEVGVRYIVDLDGGFEGNFQRQLARWQAAQGRVLVFTGVDWGGLAAQRDVGERAAAQLEADVRAGARGLKVWKDLGLRHRDAQGNLLLPDDPRLDPLWARAGDLGVPVLIHTADPVAFFDPVDRFNERYEELSAVPDWSFHRPDFPSYATLVGSLARLVERHAATTFIGAHVASSAENLAWVSALLDRCPNLYVDFGARVAELGRQPHTARRFFVRHADRILFGADYAPDAAWYHVAYRFLESSDDYFPYWPPGGGPGQGRWYIYGLALPDDVLEQVYWRTPARVLGI